MNIRFFPFLRSSLPVILLLVISTSSAMAHHLGVFAYPNGREIVVTASFGHNRPTTGGKVTVTKGNGTLLLQGTTDARGQFRFPRPKLGPKDKLIIVVNGGPGHRGTWTMTPEDLGTGRAKTKPPVSTAITSGAKSVPASSLSAQEQQYLARLVSEAVAREIEPLKAMMARQVDTGPSLQNIIGGIGWLIGLGGLLAAWKSRKKK